jgi:hypothetical protein
VKFVMMKYIEFYQLEVVWYPIVTLFLLFPGNCTNKKNLYLLFYQVSFNCRKLTVKRHVIHRVTQWFKLETSLVSQPCFEWELKRRALWYCGILIDGPFWLQHIFSTEYDVTTVSTYDFNFNGHINITQFKKIKNKINNLGVNRSTNSSCLLIL